MAPKSRSSGLRLVKGEVVAERYELLGVLGSGVEPTVFRARDFLSGEEVALKVFRAIALKNPASLKAFCRDLAVLRDDPPSGIIRVLDFDRAGEAFYIAMELAQGAPLVTAARGESRWSEGAVLDFLEQLMQALAWLHAHGVVHGDVRPSNLVWDGEAIQLMDFGPQRDARQVVVEAPDSYCAYASPERLLGRPLTAASDLYSAAAVAYDLLVGAPPHSGMVMLERAVADAPRVRARAPEISEELARIVESCLDPDSALRPLDAGSVARACSVLHGGRRHSGPAVPGRSLANRISAQPCDAGEMSALLLDVCRALDSIHGGGLAHPDLAPQNIRIAEDGRASIESYPAPPPNSTLQMTAPKYAAPELLLSHGASDESAHAAADIYVLGLVAYEALAGQDAFQQEFFPEGGEAESDLFWMKWHADTQARVRPLAEVNPAVSHEFSRLIERMMEKDPAARLSSLSALQNGLEHLRRRMNATEDVEMSRASATASQPKEARSLLRVLLAAAALSAVCGWGLWSASRGIPSLNLIRHRAGRVMTSLRRRSSSAEPAPSLPARVETAGGPMVLVPAGRFVIGSGALPNESPAHTVYLSDFYIDQYEVTNGRYRVFTDSAGYPQPAAPSWDADYFAKSSHPVLNVSWRDAQAFCSSVGKRLPTEAEWEKAARGAAPGSRTWANWTVAGLANLKRIAPAGPAPVGSFPADLSPFGAYDMAGNVHEWVNDRYGLYSGNPAALDPPGAAKVVRGGSFALSPPELSPSWRASLDPVVVPGADSPVGFRCAADAALLSRPTTQSPR